MLGYAAVQNVLAVKNMQACSLGPNTVATCPTHPLCHDMHVSGLCPVFAQHVSDLAKNSAYTCVACWASQDLFRLAHPVFYDTVTRKHMHSMYSQHN